ncbi:MAG: hypothetical protein F4187_10540 [Gemmatimonadetes bacterium]|nr:hypothetical protein [Gemmatimonadota bacterium]
MVLGLTVIAITQLVVLGARARALGPVPDFLTDGDDISTLSLRRVDGTVVRLGDGRRTLLLVFDPECPHTRLVAPAWAVWLSAVDTDDLRILAAAPGSPGPAEAYGREMGWRVPVATLEGLDEDTAELVAGRVPWVIAVDEEGVVVSEGHGSKVSEVAGTNRRGGGRVPGA